MEEPAHTFLNHKDGGSLQGLPLFPTPDDSSPFLIVHQTYKSEIANWLHSMN